MYMHTVMFIYMEIYLFIHMGLFDTNSYILLELEMLCT